jgi:hypothetical protein
MGLFAARHEQPGLSVVDRGLAGLLKKENCQGMHCLCVLVAVGWLCGAAQCNGRVLALLCEAARMGLSQGRPAHVLQSIELPSCWEVLAAVAAPVQHRHGAGKQQTNAIFLVGEHQGGCGSPSAAAGKQQGANNACVPFL